MFSMLIPCMDGERRVDLAMKKQLENLASSHLLIAIAIRGHGSQMTSSAKKKVTKLSQFGICLLLNTSLTALMLISSHLFVLFLFFFDKMMS